MAALNTLLLIAALILTLPALVFVVQVLAALNWKPLAPPAGKRPRLAVLVPAHDEAAGIARSLQSIRPQLAEGDRLLVVADNCSDGTAAIARAQGAEVLERQDEVRRGKGYALDFGVRHLEADPPALVVIIDADCCLAPGSLESLARRCQETGRPIQALDLMHAPPGAGLKTRVAEFAWLVKNMVRPLGYAWLEQPCQLMGTGMALPWPLLAGASLANGHIVEDLKLGLELALAGHPPLFCPEALVSSHFPASAEGVNSQRARWEHGHLGLICGEAPRLLLTALTRRNGPLLALALDLLVPPVALLMLLILALTGLAAAFHLPGTLALPLSLSTALLLGWAILAAWWRFGRKVLSATDLLAALGYALWKIPLYLKFLVGRQVEWVRSRRDAP